MVDQGKAGTDWTDDELDIVVADYFAMLADELAGKAYVKAHHREVVVKQIGRSHGSVEFKHQNISAVLQELGLPWIFGYKPAVNFQRALFDAIEFFLTRTELEVADERQDAWHLYRVHQFAQKPQILTVRPPLKTALQLDPETWRAHIC